MAHNLNFKDGKASMAYFGEKPWHQLGTAVDHAMTSAEAIELAGLNYEVAKFPIKADVEGKLVEVPGKYATVRKDTNDALGVVGSRYTILQNQHAFQFFDGIVGIKEAMYHTAGALGKGEKVWILAKLPGTIRTVGDDVTEKFLLLSNSHDGSSTIDILWTPIRVVCQNTLNVALGDNSNKIRLRHTASVGLKIEDVREALGLANQKFEMFEDLSRQLATVKIGEAEFKALIKGSGLVPNVKDEELSTRANNIIEEVSNLFETGRGADLEGAKGTAWGAFNSVVEYVDYFRSRNEASRAESLLYGAGAQIKQKAWDAAVALVKA